MMREDVVFPYNIIGFFVTAGRWYLPLRLCIHVYGISIRCNLLFDLLFWKVVSSPTIQHQSAGILSTHLLHSIPFSHFSSRNARNYCEKEGMFLETS